MAEKFSATTEISPNDSVLLANHYPTADLRPLLLHQEACDSFEQMGHYYALLVQS